MTHTRNCCLCRILSGERKFGAADEPFMESNNYMAIASIGSFIEGWSMVVPKAHKLSLVDEYNNTEFLHFTESVVRHITKHYGRAVMFEHGASRVGSATGCGVDHAHFHIVPHGESLTQVLEESGFWWDSCYASDIADLSDGKDYLFYCDEVSTLGIRGLLHAPDNPKSQYFRRILADKLNKTEVYDYKRFPHLDTAIETHKNLISKLSL